jgi:hypothetical protein
LDRSLCAQPGRLDAWDHSIKAVETMGIQIVTPTKAKATLGDVAGTLTSQGHLWQLVLHGHDDLRTWHRWSRCCACDE